MTVIDPAGGPDASGVARAATIRVVLAEDESLILDALSTLLAIEGDLDVCATFGRGDDALAWLIENPVDVAVLDNHMPGADGLTIAAALRDAGSPTAVIIVSGQAHPEEMRRAMKIPVLGFCTKGISGHQLADTIRTVNSGRRWLDPDLAASVITAESNPLREREIDVLRLIAEGKSTKDVATELFLTPGTVRNYVSSACTKLGVTNKIAALHRAVENGWL